MRTPTTNLTLTQLSYVVALAEKRHFGQAARECGVSQPTLSIQIQKLEDELGVMIFDRSKQPIIPTALGGKLIEQARRVLQEARQIDEIVVHQKEEVSGSMKLAIIPTLAPYLLPLFLPAFSNQFPKVRLHLLELETSQILDRLKTEEIDAGILVTPLNDKAIQEKPIFWEPFWAYVSDSHPLFKKKSVRAHDLPLNEVWLLKEGHCFRDQVLNICEPRKKPQEKRPLPQFESGSLDSLKALVDQGIGLTLLPDLAIRKFTRKEEKHRVKPITHPTPVREVSLVQTRIFAKKKIVDALIQSIRDNLPPELLEKRAFEIISIV